MNRQERQQQRADYYADKASKARRESVEAFNTSHKLTENIPMGQPVVGSLQQQKRHRKTLDKSWDALGRSAKLSDKAEYYEDKSDAAENNTSIYMGDDDAVERLRQKVKELEEMQEQMKAINKIVRNKKLTAEQKIQQVHDMGLSTENATKIVTVPNCFGGLGFESFSLSNNNARIRDAKQKLERAELLKGMEIKEYEIKGVKVVENPPENRLQLFFDGKPSQEIREALSDNGFRWAHSIGAWQAYFKRWNIDRAKEIINTMC